MNVRRGWVIGCLLLTTFFLYPEYGAGRIRGILATAPLVGVNVLLLVLHLTGGESG